MLIRVGHEITILTERDTPLLSMVSPHISRHGDFLAPESFETFPEIPVEQYYDRFGNICRRMTAPAGIFSLRNDVILRDNGLPEPVDPTAPETPVDDLPDEAFAFLAGSRYVETDLISQESWDRFGQLEPGWDRVQAVIEHVHRHIRFDYQQARATRTATEANREGVGVCRDFAHLALALLRALNIPARYVNGYVGDIGVPAPSDPMDFAAWIEVYLGNNWWTFDPRNNQRRIGRVVIARGLDAADVPILNSFGQHKLESFTVWCHPVDEQGNQIETGRLSA